MINDKDIELAREIVLRRLRGYQVKVFLFGSQAKGSARKTSDIDIAVWPEQSLPDGLLSDIRQELEDSQILAVVDLVDLSYSDLQFRKRVMKEGILWLEGISNKI